MEQTLREGADNIKKDIVKKYPEMQSLDEKDSKVFEMILEDMAKEIVMLEKAAKKLADPENFKESLRDKDIKAIWIFSGPGTFYKDTVNDDRPVYREALWTRWMDKEKILAGARAFHALKSHGLDVPVYYNGTEIENLHLHKAIKTGDVDVPAEKFIIEGDESIKDTYTQILYCPFIDALLPKGGNILAVAYAPHISRIVRMFKQSGKVPEGQKIIVLPLPTPNDGKHEYMKMEIRGAAYYRLLSPIRKVHEEPAEYEVLGE